MHRRIAIAALLLLVLAAPLAVLRATEQPRVALPLLRDGRPATVVTPNPAATVTATPTGAPSPTATLAPTATSTPSPTAKVTPPACESIYPIAINSQLIAGEQFVPPTEGTSGDGWRVLTSGPFAGHTARLVRFGTISGEAVFLRWKYAGTSSAALQESLRFPGNLGAGFQEAPWPDPSPPAGYPLQPGRLNVGDWVSGSVGYRSAVDAILTEHQVNQNELVLPLYDSAAGSGANVQRRVGGLQRFVLLDHRTVGGAPVLDLVLLGAARGAPLCPPANP